MNRQIQDDALYNDEEEEKKSEGKYRIIEMIIPLLIGLFQLFVIVLGIVYIVSFIIWLLS